MKQSPDQEPAVKEIQQPKETPPSKEITPFQETSCKKEPEQAKEEQPKALIIGFDEDPNFKFNPGKNPFLKRPPLRSQALK
jgi:hypothetical protein